MFPSTPFIVIAIDVTPSFVYVGELRPSISLSSSLKSTSPYTSFRSLPIKNGINGKKFSARIADTCVSDYWIDDSWGSSAFKNPGSNKVMKAQAISRASS